MTTDVSTSSGKKPKEETNVVETLQSLVFAFAIAMAVRSFVTEGFFIPTGSMAPTLMGQHVRPRSPATGFEYAADAGPSFEMMRQLGQNYRDLAAPVIDPMLSMTDPIAQTTTNEIARNARMGDRVLVLKYLYAFSEPQRWDVVVFKNPTDPTGDAANFIKRLVGLPEEQLLLLDGDVFTAPLGADRSEFEIARKPEHVQRTVWIPVHDSDFVPVDPSALAKVWGRPWPGLPWESSEFDFGPKGNARVWTHGSAAPATISWRWDRRPITDFTSYNVWRQIPVTQRFAMSDVRVSMAVVAEDPAALAIEETILTRKRALRFMLDGSKATLRVEDASEGAPAEGARVFAETSVPFEAPGAGAPYDVEFWHVDQQLSLWVNGERIAALDYEFDSLEDRLTASFNGRTVEDYRRNAPIQQPTPPVLSVRFAGSPVELHRVRVDRDLYYRPANLRDDDFNQPAENGEPITGAAFATDFDAPAQLRSDQFLMLGDNSAASRDSRLWGRPSPLVTKVFGEGDPFVVPRQLLLGKAWCVYFPAPVSPMPGWPAVLPDFGKLRFIR